MPKVSLCAPVSVMKPIAEDKIRCGAMCCLC
jgi:hypothetical protein